MRQRLRSVKYRSSGASLPTVLVPAVSGPPISPAGPSPSVIWGCSRSIRSPLSLFRRRLRSSRWAPSLIGWFPLKAASACGPWSVSPSLPTIASSMVPRRPPSSKTLLAPCKSQRNGSSSMTTIKAEQLPPTVSSGRKRKGPLYTALWFQVCVAISLAIALGYFSPARAVAMKPLGDAFIRLITIIVTPIIFCTVVSGIAGMHDLKKVGRVGGKALLYFEAVSTLALFIGLVVGNVVHPGGSFHVSTASLDAKAVESYAGQAKTQGVTDTNFTTNIE